MKKWRGIKKPVSDWQTLRNRYSSLNQYNKRVALNPSCLEEFSNWLVDIGADVFSNTEQYEILRFTLNGKLGIWYQKGSGDLLMHDLAQKFIDEGFN